MKTLDTEPFRRRSVDDLTHEVALAAPRRTLDHDDATHRSDDRIQVVDRTEGRDRTAKQVPLHSGGSPFGHVHRSLIQQVVDEPGEGAALNSSPDATCGLRIDLAPDRLRCLEVAKGAGESGFSLLPHGDDLLALRLDRATIPKRSEV